MLVEERICTLHLGKVPEYLQHCVEPGCAVQWRSLGNNVGDCSVDIGPQRTVVHLWAYRDATDRERRRAARAADAVWLAHLPRVRPLVLTQDTRILKPAGFFADRVRTQLETPP